MLIETKKKMNILQKKTNSSLLEIKGYTWPKLYTGKDWYVGFYAFDPAQNKMRRKKNQDQPY